MGGDLVESEVDPHLPGLDAIELYLGHPRNSLEQIDGPLFTGFS